VQEIREWRRPQEKGPGKELLERRGEKIGQKTEEKLTGKEKTGVDLKQAEITI
jgi:hypothetical protein